MFRIDPLTEKFIVKAMWPVRSEYEWQWRVVEFASTESWRKFVAKVREKGYSLAILVHKKIDVVGTGEASRTEVEQTHIEVVEEINICMSGQEETVEEVTAPADLVVPGSNCSLNDGVEDEPESPLAVNAAEENDAVVKRWNWRTMNIFHSWWNWELETTTSLRIQGCVDSLYGSTWSTRHMIAEK